jgi:hypothetical protein
VLAVAASPCSLRGIEACRLAAIAVMLLAAIASNGREAAPAAPEAPPAPLNKGEREKAANMFIAYEVSLEVIKSVRVLLPLIDRQDAQRRASR